MGCRKGLYTGVLTLFVAHERVPVDVHTHDYFGHILRYVHELLWRVEQAYTLFGNLVNSVCLAMKKALYFFLLHKLWNGHCYH